MEEPRVDYSGGGSQRNLRLHQPRLRQRRYGPRRTGPSMEEGPGAGPDDYCKVADATVLSEGAGRPALVWSHRRRKVAIAL